MDGNYPYHTGLVTDVSTNDEGNTVITFGHNSSGNGAQSDSFVLGSGESWDSNSPAFSNGILLQMLSLILAVGHLQQLVNVIDFIIKNEFFWKERFSRISSTVRNVRGQVAFLAEGRRRILGRINFEELSNEFENDKNELEITFFHYCFSFITGYSKLQNQ